LKNQVTSDDILNFWFIEIENSQRWVKDVDFDSQIKDRFREVHASANQCELFDWRATAKGRLAEIIVLDQFSRNMFRGAPESFASDPLALALAQEAVAHGFDDELNSSEKCFLYMPYMHSESIKIHEVAMELFGKLGNHSNLNFEIRHRKIIEEFGRYPHRNEILGRASTDAEIKFLSQPGSKF
jgi:uncharacterized protein (DUF924 family)